MPLKANPKAIAFIKNSITNITVKQISIISTTLAKVLLGSMSGLLSSIVIDEITMKIRISKSNLIWFTMKMSFNLNLLVSENKNKLFL